MKIYKDIASIKKLNPAKHPAFTARPCRCSGLPLSAVAMHHSPVSSCWMQDASAQDVASIYLLLQRFTADALVAKASAKRITQTLGCFSVAHSHYIPDRKVNHNTTFVVNRKNQFLPQVVGCCAIVPIEIKYIDKQRLAAFANDSAFESTFESTFHLREIARSKQVQTGASKNESSKYFFFELRSVAVDPLFQSAGVGRKLVEYALRKVQRQFSVLKNKKSCKTLDQIKSDGENATTVADISNSNRSDAVAVVFCLSKRGSFFEKMGFEITSRKDIPFDETDDPRYLATRELRGVKLYSKRLFI